MTTKDRLRIRPPDGCNAIVFRFWDGAAFDAVTSACRSRMLFWSDQLGLPRTEVHAERSERRGVLVLRGTAENVGSPRNLNLVEPAFSQERD